MREKKFNIFKRLSTSTKKIITYIMGAIFIIFVLCIYYELCTPDMIKAFYDYNGICFDYTLEEDNYKNKLYYKQLNDDEAMHYRCMYHAAINNEREYYLASENLFNLDDANTAAMAFEYDFPEYFWFGYSLLTKNDHVKDKINFLETEYLIVYSFCSMSPYTIEKSVNEVEEKLNEIIPSLVGEDDYSTIKNVYDYLIENVTYSYSYIKIADVRAALIYERAVCSSYAETFQLICNRLGYECYTVYGKANNLFKDEDPEYNEFEIYFENDFHEWNIININGCWYWVDPTWGDGDYEYTNVFGDKAVQHDYSYFLVPDKVFFLDHNCDDSFLYPNCNDDTYYLYNGSGAIIDEYSDSLIEKNILSAFKDGRKDFTFHFFSKEDLNKFIEWFERKTFYDIYQYNIYPYYYGSAVYYTSNNYSVFLNWNIKNYY